jgi:hypothetical protein
MTIVLFVFYFILFYFDDDESLRINCHKKMKVVPIYIFSEIEVSFIFHVMSILIFFLAY